MKTNPIPRVILNRASAPVAFVAGDTKRKGTVLAGQVDLVSGLAIVVIPGITADMVAKANIRTPGGTIGAQYKCELVANNLKISSIRANKAVETGDTSSMQYIVVVG